jgi:hypothetical protein
MTMKKYKTPPRIKIISHAELRKRTRGTISRGAETIGNTIYATKDAGDFVLEHEKAHIKLGHRPAKLTGEQFIRRELKADRIAVDKTGIKYHKKDLEDIVYDTANVFNAHKNNVRPVVIKEAKKLKLIK